MIRQIATQGDPVLSQIARDVTDEELQTPELQQIIDDMLQTLKSTTGVGLAAPQISESLRIVIVDKPMTVLINPIVTPVGDVTDTSYEGCLSVPGMRGEVRRALTVRVEYLDRSGKRVDTTWTKFRAIVVQHEVDHLNGILYPERATFLFPDDTVHAPKAPPVAHGTGVWPSAGGGRKTFVVESPEAVGGKQFFSWQFHETGRVVDVRVQPGGAIVAGVWLSGVRLRTSGIKAGALGKMLLGEHGLHVNAGDQLRVELHMVKGKKRLIAEADFDAQRSAEVVASA
jgi:peptide deformylase